jgi:hypothetical protein
MSEIKKIETVVERIKSVDYKTLPIEVSLNPEFMTLITEIITIVEDLETSGEKRKNLLLDTLDYLITKTDWENNEKIAWKVFIRTAVPPLIDTLVNLTKKINIEVKSFCCC